MERFLRINALTFLILLFAADITSAQVSDTSDYVIGILPKEEPDPLRKVTVSGFYRFFATHTRHFEPYVLNPIINDTVIPNSLFLADDSQLPNFQLNIAGRPSDKTSWSFDVYAFQFFLGDLGETYGAQIPDSLRPSFQDPLSGARLGSVMNLNLGINFTGSHETKFGTFTLRAGGIHWLELSDLTMASFRGYNRFTLFETNPWDPVGTQVNTRYETYYNEGGINQDTRWGNRAFKGVILDGAALPHDLSFTTMFGKSEFNGGFSPLPNYTYGGRVRKKTKDNDFVGINTINSYTFADSLATEKVGFNLITTEFSQTVQGFNLHVEGGTGQYYSPDNNEGWGGLISGTLTTPKHKKIPQFSIHYFYISPKVINNNSIFLNTAVTEYITTDIPAGSVGSSAVLQPFGSSMVRIGQMTNNRQGIDVNIEHPWKNFKFNVGLSTQSEIEPIAATITFGHPVNQLTRSRMWRYLFPSEVGPYGNYNVIFRDVYEVVNLSDDSSGVAVNKKHFNVFEPQVKYKAKVFNKDLYVYYLGYFSSVQRNWAAFVVTDEEAYIRQYANELELYYQVSDIIMLSAYIGYERTLGNYLTDINEETRRPRNQTGNGYGAGIDIDLGRNANLYLRNRWFYFEDESFPLDKFRGQETLVELKIFF